MWRVSSALVVLAALALAPSPSLRAQAWVQAYEEDFGQGPGGWLTNDGRGGHLPSRLRWSADGFVRSQSPWWIDRNHEAPGAGNLHLVAVLHLGRRFGGLPYDAVDLRNARIEFRIRQAQTLRLFGARLVFWFQARDPASGKLVNYAYTRHDLSKALHPDAARWRRLELRLDTDEASWTCLGASADRADTYGCAASVAKAMSQVDVDFGLVLLPVNDLRLPSGAVDLDDFALWLAVP